MEIIATFTARGNRNNSTKKELPHTLEITRHIPSVLNSRTIERVALYQVANKSAAREMAKMNMAVCWNY